MSQSMIYCGKLVIFVKQAKINYYVPLFKSNCLQLNLSTISTE